MALYTWWTNEKGFCVRWSNGDVKWDYATMTTLHCSPTIGPDGTLYIHIVNIMTDDEM